MKKIILAILLAISFNGIAQTAIKKENINQEILHPEKKFELLDKAEITTGNLINRALIFSDHTQFYKDSVKTNSYGGWQQLYHEISKGYYDKILKISNLLA